AVAGGVLASAVAGAGEADPSALESLVKELAAGTLTAAVGLAPGLSAEPGADGGLVINGSCGPVLGGCLADLLILPAGRGAAQAWVAVDAGAVTGAPPAGLGL